MRQYYVADLPPLHTTDGAAYNTSVTLTDVGPAPSIVIPANGLEVGQRLEFMAFGRMSNVATTPTLNLGIYYGTGTIASGMAIATTGAITTTTAAVTNQTWWLEGFAQVRAVGTGTNGSILGGFTIQGISGTAGTESRLAPATAPTALACDTTVANKIMLGATWGTSASGNTLTCHAFTVRLCN